MVFVHKRLSNAEIRHLHLCYIQLKYMYVQGFPLKHDISPPRQIPHRKASNVSQNYRNAIVNHI